MAETPPITINAHVDTSSEIILKKESPPLEMSQNSERLSWTFEEVDAKLKGIMEGIFHASYDASVAAGSEGNLMVGANCAGFLKVATAMMAQGITY